MTNLFNIIEDVAEKNDLVSIRKVELVIGEMRQIVPVAMEMAFEAISKETIAESAVLEMEFIPIRMKCNKCENEFEVGSNIYICPECGGSDLKLVQGQELMIKNITGEERDGN